jgi:uncharacterized protein YkwD
LLYLRGCFKSFSCINLPLSKPLPYKERGYNYRWAGENIAYGQTSAQEVMQSWMNSAGHRQNILNPKFRDVGIAYAYGNTFYWTQNFGA